MNRNQSIAVILLSLAILVSLVTVVGTIVHDYESSQANTEGPINYVINENTTFTKEPSEPIRNGPYAVNLTIDLP